MDSDTLSEPISDEQTPIKTTWIDIVFIGLLINLGIVILVSIGAVILNREYLDNLIFLGIITVIVFICVIILILVLSLGLPMIAKRIFNWDEDKETDWIINLLFVLSFVLVIGAAIGLYILVLPSFPVVQDPFNLNAINSMFGTIYSIWWFFGFIISALVITLLYLLLEAGRYG
ncbi:MAG: hypothetical protein JSW11_12320 [Candidatus Heimdallarchaeota archaeon]|nr:MAG: hypothetical protein JSW11_12320 [Candidatus Heimdallarchaeota archaeon]